MGGIANITLFSTIKFYTMDEYDIEKEITHQRNPVRIINLTDAVFAIIMTLLVLEIKIPEEPPHSIQALRSALPYLLLKRVYFLKRE